MKVALQIVVLVLVAWGIAHSVRKSASQLANQRESLLSEAAMLRTQAAETHDPQLQQVSLMAAAELERSARNYWRADPLRLVAAGGFYFLGMLPASLFWRQCLMAVEQPSRPLSVLWAYFYGNLGKYFPGKAMVLVLRVAALDQAGMKKTVTSMTIFMETLTMMSVGGAMSAGCLILLGVDWRLTLLACGLLVATFIPTYPPLLRYLLPKLQRGVEPELVAQWSGRIDGKLFVRGWLLLTLTWVAFGISLWLVLGSIPIADFSQASWTTRLLSCLGACALAVVLGFVSLIPGGAGVREAVLSTVLSPVVGPAAALSGAIWLRVVWLATELIVVGILFVTKRVTAGSHAG